MGRLVLRWELAERQRLAVLSQHAPLRALFPREQDGADAVIVNTAGGVVGGDRLEVDVTLGPAASVLLTSQAAEKVYRSAGPTSHITTRLRLDADATLAWVPQETILFDASRLRRVLSVDMHPRATLLAAEMLVFGRLARGESLHDASFRDAWDVRIGERLVWADRFGLAPPNQDVLDVSALGGDAKALATAVFISRDAVSGLEPARAALVALAGVRSGVTAVNGLLVARFLGAEPSGVRRSLAATLAAWRGVLLGQPARLPRLWAI